MPHKYPKHKNKRKNTYKPFVNHYPDSCRIIKSSTNITKEDVKAEAKALFYKSFEWREVRYKVFKLSNGCCCLCGRDRKYGIVLHVDHIKPISKYPELKLEINNLQVLCEDCNIGKSNKDETDWR